jgi:hypothetical protein
MINPYYDVWFAAQLLAPESFVMDICSVQQIQPDWLRWIGDALPANQESAWSPGTINPFQHVFSLLRHCVFLRDALLAKATTQRQQSKCFRSFSSSKLAPFFLSSGQCAPAWRSAPDHAAFPLLPG